MSKLPALPVAPLAVAQIRARLEAWRDQLNTKTQAAAWVTVTNEDREWVLSLRIILPEKKEKAGPSNGDQV